MKPITVTVTAKSELPVVSVPIIPSSRIIIITKCTVITKKMKQRNTTNCYRYRYYDYYRVCKMNVLLLVKVTIMFMIIMMIMIVVPTTTAFITTTTTTTMLKMMTPSQQQRIRIVDGNQNQQQQQYQKLQHYPKQQQQQYYRSSLIRFNMVSELHVPGYATTKLAFVVANRQQDRIEQEEQEQQQQPEEYQATQQEQESYVHSSSSGGSVLTRTVVPTTTTTTTSTTTNILPRYESFVPYNSNGYLIHRTKKPVLSINECTTIIQEAESIALQRGSWTINRHGNYPTTDLPLVELPLTLQLFNNKLQNIIYPLLRHQFGFILPSPYAIRVADGFVVKYDAKQGQRELKPHRDGSILSINIALNPFHDYTDGGTWFQPSLIEGGNSNTTTTNIVRLQQGHLLSHTSSILHGGAAITSGIRYILVAFIIVEGYDSWSMRFYNQIRNL